MFHLLILLGLSLVGIAQGQDCLNYGIPTGFSCQCPPQFGGTLCDSLTCGNPLQSPVDRPVLAGTSCEGQCQAGFSGVGCNVCTTAQACSAAPGSGQATLTPDASSGIASTLDNSTIVCNTSPYVYTQGFVDCNVENVAISSIFPGSTTLSIQKSLQPNISLSWPFGEAGSLLAQLFYSANTSTPPEEQFYCQASSCSQSYSSDQAFVDYNCAALDCTCITGRTFCGGQNFDLSSVINTLTGPLEISCATNTTDCSFRQSVLQGLFGPEGLGLTGCSSGECVRQGVIDRLDPTVAAANGSSLSAGVIAGLAIVGALLLAVLVLFLLGKIRQRKARRAIAAPLGSIRQVGLAWQDISYTLAPTSNTSFLRRRKRGSALLQDSSLETGNGSNTASGKILHSISGQAPCGQMLAIIGASGAGKSTLVDILGGKRKVGNIAGAVSLLESSESYEGAKATIGYVDQEDVLPHNSTVREALMFAAQLKMPESIRDDAKRQRIEQILDQLGLTRIADSRIGSTEKRGISGGERRRLSIGLELMAQPSVLILDEPTSGLDSVSALRVIEVLRNLAQGSSGTDNETSSLKQPRTTIIATIHQPSSRIYHSFDLVCVLAEGGRQLYFGPAAKAEATFADQGFLLPAGFNMADHLLEIASMPEEKRPSPIYLAQGDLSRTTSKQGKDHVGAQDSISTLERESDQAFPPSSQPHSQHAPVTGVLTQLEVLSARELHSLVRDKSLLLAHNGVAIILGVFIGGLYYKTDTSIAGFQNRIGALFFLGALIAFSALSALSNFAALRPLFLRERAGSYYSPSAWLASRILFDIIPLRIVPTILVATIAYWMVGLSGAAAAFFKYLLIMVEYSIAATLLNLLLATVIKAGGVAVLFSAILCLFQMAFAGFFLNLQRVPAVLRWLQWICPLKYALEALAVNEVNTGLPIQDTLSGVNIEVSASLIMELLFGFKPNAYYRDVLVLFAWIALFGGLTTLSVKYLMRELR